VSRDKGQEVQMKRRSSTDPANERGSEPLKFLDNNRRETREHPQSYLSKATVFCLHFNAAPFLLWWQ